MTTKEAAKKWNVTEKYIAELCKDNVIPAAYKENRKWVIPDMDKPPAGRMGLIKHMKLLESINDGAKPKIDEQLSKSIFVYLAKAGFITALKKSENILDSLKGVKVTTLGEELIHSIEPNYKVNTETTISVEGKIGPLTGRIERKKTKKAK